MPAHRDAGVVVGQVRRFRGYSAQVRAEKVGRGTRRGWPTLTPEWKGRVNCSNS